MESVFTEETGMNRNPNRQARLAYPVRVIWFGVKRLWRKMGFFSGENYPDWMMYIPNPLPPTDEPASGESHSPDWHNPVFRMDRG